jgi:putative restriction endonuclease
MTCSADAMARLPVYECLRQSAPYGCHSSRRPLSLQSVPLPDLKGRSTVLSRSPRATPRRVRLLPARFGWPTFRRLDGATEREDSPGAKSVRPNEEHGAMARIFGEIPGNPPGSVYANRTALAQAGVHKPLQHGISGAASEGADSIVVSGGYEDDEDYGDLIVYTGAGGRDPATGQQIDHQEFKGQNLGLVRSESEGLPVRVTRGAGGDAAYSPTVGFRYEGLFRVEESWREVGKSGFSVCRYRLIRIGDGGTPVPIDPKALPPGPAPRAETTVQRIVRNSAVSQQVKALHNYACQVCGTRIEIASGAYAEGAHIRALGRPHDGPDVTSNVLCLCPNDHVRFEYGAIVIDDQLTIIERETNLVLGTLRTTNGHLVDTDQLAYHRQHFDLLD